jgi:Flp pilus assembly protein TadG
MKRQAFSAAKKLLKSERGNVLVIAAATMPLLIGSAALAIDTIQMGLWKRQLQRAADSAALAGAYARVQNGTPSDAVSRDLQLNNDVTLLGTPEVGVPTSGTFAGNPRAVRVVLTSQRAMPFMAFFTSSAPKISAEATAASIFQGVYCMRALEDENVTGITFTGSASVDLGCGVHSNSRAAIAVLASGSAVIKANPIAAVGGVPASSGYVQPTTLLPYSLKQDDPYAGLPRTPSPPSGCTPVTLDVQPNNTLDLNPSGTAVAKDYCVTGGVDVKGTLKLAPGTYYIDGGTFKLNAQSVVTGTGVTIILTTKTPTISTSFANIDIHGGATVNLTSPTSGTYKGLLMYMDPRAPFGESQINGNSSSSFEGGIYAPSRQLTFNGTTGMQTKCLQMVARRLSFSGNSKVENVCPTTGGGRAFDATFVRLVA